MLYVKPATPFGELEKGKDPEGYRDPKGHFYVAGEFEVDYKTFAQAEAANLESGCTKNT